MNLGIDLIGAGVVPGTEDAILSTASGSAELVVRNGDTAAGLGGALNYTDITGRTPTNNLGDVLFRSALSGAGVNESNDFALFAQIDGLTELVVREGDPAPGTPAGVNFGGLENDSYVFNSAGDVAFQSGLTNGASRGLFHKSSDSFEAVALVGMAAPGTPLGTNFQSFYSGGLTINDAGQIAFNSTLSNGDAGIYSTQMGSLLPVAFRGEDAPGINLQANFRTFANPTINGVGDVAFLAILEGFGVGR